VSSTNARRTAKRERDAWQFRYDLCAEVGRCEGCMKRKRVNELACHELLYGALLQDCLDQRCALLVVADCCHRKVQNETKARQLARLYLSRAADLDFLRFCELWKRAPTAIMFDEVMAEVDLLLENRK